MIDTLIHRADRPGELGAVEALVGVVRPEPERGGTAETVGEMHGDQINGSKDQDLGVLVLRVREKGEMISAVGAETERPDRLPALRWTCRVIP